MYLTDSHIHLQDYKGKNAHQIVVDMQKSGFEKIICVSTKPKEWGDVANIADMENGFVVPAFGVHPWYVNDVSLGWEKELENYLQKYAFALVGECGLDMLKKQNYDEQEKVFEIQANLAKKYNRPMNIHLLKAEDKFCKLHQLLPKKFMIHAFGGSLPFLQKVVDWGGYVSLSYALVKRKNFAEIIQNMPISRLLFESDGPYMSEYEKIEFLAEEVAKIKKMAKNEVIEKVCKNFEEFCYGG